MLTKLHEFEQTISLHALLSLLCRLLMLMMMLLLLLLLLLLLHHDRICDSLLRIHVLLLCLLDSLSLILRLL